MSINDPYDHECAANHFPDWVDKLSTTLHACMSDKERSRTHLILVEYNELIDREEDPDEDGHSLFGVENEKQELIEEYIKICEKYREEAETLYYMLHDER